MVVQLAVTSDVLRSCPKFVLAKIGERISVRRAPQSVVACPSTGPSSSGDFSVVERSSTPFWVVKFLG